MRAIFQERRGKDVHIFTLFTKKEKGGEKERKDYGYWYILLWSNNGLDNPDHLKLGWIRKQQSKFLNQARETPRECITRESHYYLGKRYLLRVIEHNAPPKVTIIHDTIELCVRPHTSQKKRQEIMDEWYRKGLRELVPAIIAQYEQIMDVKVHELGIKKMRTRWGTCSRNRKRVWLNLELTKKPREYIEYIVVHEMVHLLEKHHNGSFAAYMDKFLPKWRHYKEALNRIPLRHENWTY